MLWVVEASPASAGKVLALVGQATVNIFYALKPQTPTPSPPKPPNSSLILSLYTSVPYSPSLSSLRAFVRDCNSTSPRFRTLLGLIKPYIVLISSFNPGGCTFGGDTIESLILEPTYKLGIGHFPPLHLQWCWAAQSSPTVNNEILALPKSLGVGSSNFWIYGTDLTSPAPQLHPPSIHPWHPPSQINPLRRSSVHNNRGGCKMASTIILHMRAT